MTAALRSRATNLTTTVAMVRCYAYACIEVAYPWSTCLRVGVICFLFIESCCYDVYISRGYLWPIEKACASQAIFQSHATILHPTCTLCMTGMRIVLDSFLLFVVAVDWSIPVVWLMDAEDGDAFFLSAPTHYPRSKGGRPSLLVATMKGDGKACLDILRHGVIHPRR